jgi:hypothetical protein
LRGARFSFGPQSSHGSGNVRGVEAPHRNLANRLPSSHRNPARRTRRRRHPRSPSVKSLGITVSSRTRRPAPPLDSSSNNTGSESSPNEHQANATEASSGSAPSTRLPSQTAKRTRYLQSHRARRFSVERAKLPATRAEWLSDESGLAWSKHHASPKSIPVPRTPAKHRDQERPAESSKAKTQFGLPNAVSPRSPRDGQNQHPPRSEDSQVTRYRLKC